MTRQRRTGLFIAICAVAVAIVAIYLGVTVLGAGGDDPTVPKAGAPAVTIADGDLLVLDRDRRHPKAWGRLVVVGRDGRRTLGSLTCARVAFAGGTGICMAQSRTFPTPAYQARLFDRNEHVFAKIDVPGTPSRARVSPDGRYAASTTFVGGDAYTNPGQFSTRTRVYDVRARKTIGDLEDFTVTQDGRTIKKQDFNFWGVTFTGEGAKFYATLGTGTHHYLIRGDAQAKTAEVVRDGIECPSLSPDGTRIGFKARVGKPFQWRFHVLDLASGKETALPETRSVDDQIAWLDDRTLAYGVDEQVMQVPADGSAAPRVLLAGATNPGRVR
jgi:hypothetical protein